MNKIALIDLDGTLADYDAALEASYDELIDRRELSYSKACSLFGRMTLPKHIWNRCQLIKSKPGWWRSLKVMPVGVEIMLALSQLGYDIHIASRGPKLHPQAWTEKLEWVKANVPLAKAVHLTEDKSRLNADILVDDWPSYCDDWQMANPDGLVIMPAHDYNKNCPYFRYEIGMRTQLLELVKGRV